MAPSWPPRAHRQLGPLDIDSLQSLDHAICLDLVILLRGPTDQADHQISRATSLATSTSWAAPLDLISDVDLTCCHLPGCLD